MGSGELYGYGRDRYPQFMLSESEINTIFLNPLLHMSVEKKRIERYPWKEENACE